MAPSCCSSRFTRQIVLAAAAVVFAIACRPPAVPGTRPAPEARPDDPAPAERRRPAFAYSPGTYRYELSNTAIIVVEGEIAPAETLFTRSYFTYSIAPEGAGAEVTGSVDSLVVRAGSRIPVPEEPAPTPLPFRGELPPHGRFVRAGAPGALPRSSPTQGADTTPGADARSGADPKPGAGAAPACDSPADALLVAATDLLPPPPPSLVRGTSWTDTVTTTVCRAEVPVTTTSVRRYLVEGSDVFEGSSALRIRRSSELTLSGSGEARAQLLTLRGNGTAESFLFLEPRSGRFLGATGEYTATVTLEAAAQQRTFTQRVRQRIRLLQ